MNLRLLKQVLLNKNENKFLNNKEKGKEKLIFLELPL